MRNTPFGAASLILSCSLVFAADADWFVLPSAIAPDRDFELRILSDRYGNCHTRFTHGTLSVQDGKIMATFLVETDTSLVCVVDIHPHGPAFPMSGLRAGKYPVYVAEQPACLYGHPPCPWLPPESAARLVDTLTVSGVSALAVASEGPGASAAAGKRSATLSRGKVRLVRPDAHGAGRPEIRTLSGRLLGEKGGFRAVLPAAPD